MTRASLPILILTAILSCAGLYGCSSEGGDPLERLVAERGEPQKVYTVKAVVAVLPDPNSPLSEFQARHEPIPDFLDGDGKVIGMNEMTMPFPPADGVDIDHLAIGDEVEIDFAVWWESEREGMPKTPFYRAVAIRKLDG